MGALVAGSRGIIVAGGALVAGSRGIIVAGGALVAASTYVCQTVLSGT